MTKLAEVLFSCGRYFLSVGGFTLAMEGDKCRCGDIPGDILPLISKYEMQTATIGGKPISEIEIDIVKFFRGDNWTKEMMEYVADSINNKVVELHK